MGLFWQRDCFTNNNIHVKRKNKQKTGVVKILHFSYYSQLQAKKRQVYMEETYGGSMRELELLLHNFQINGETNTTKKGRSKKTATQKDEKLSPMLVLETLRHTLKDYQNRVDSTSQEVQFGQYFKTRSTNKWDHFSTLTVAVFPTVVTCFKCLKPPQCLSTCD